MPIFSEHASADTPIQPSEKALGYAKEVEHHLFINFAEPDKNGINSVGQKYKYVY